MTLREVAVGFSEHDHLRRPDVCHRLCQCLEYACAAPAVALPEPVAHAVLKSSHSGSEGHATTGASEPHRRRGDATPCRDRCAVTRYNPAGRETSPGTGFNRYGRKDMVGRARRSKGRRQLLSNHQRCWLWGRNVVLETLRAGRWPIHELHLAETLPAADRDLARQLAEASGIPVEFDSAKSLQQRCRSGDHQGYVAKMAPFPYDDWQKLLASRSPAPLYAVLAGIQDPFNYGAILRAAEVLGVEGVFVGSTGQAEVNSLVARSSAGAINHIPLGQAEEIREVITAMQAQGIAVIAASEKTDVPCWNCDLNRPVAVLLGNEGTGIPPELLQLCDERVTIPQSGQVGSLNAAVAAGILFAEARRQRSITGPAD